MFGLKVYYFVTQYNVQSMDQFQQILLSAFPFHMDNRVGVVQVRITAAAAAAVPTIKKT